MALINKRRKNQVKIIMINVRFNVLMSHEILICHRLFRKIAKPHGRPLERVKTSELGWLKGSRFIDQFRYIKIQLKTIDLSARLWGANTEFVWFIPQILVLRSFVLDWILIYRNWSIGVLFKVLYRQQFRDFDISLLNRGFLCNTITNDKKDRSELIQLQLTFISIHVGQI